MSIKLLYVVDPMCSWCYGFKSALDEVLPELNPNVQPELVLGGLAPDSDEPMDAETRSYVQQAWHAVTAQTGATFNHGFWTACKPRRSTYPSCRAVIVAREVDLAWEMLAAIQRAYYLEARNPSDEDTLVALAEELGIDGEAFRGRFRDPEIEEALQAHLRLRTQLRAMSFPSIAMSHGRKPKLIASGCLEAAELREALRFEGLLKD
ncbi:MAG: DsbA family protein [Planctomycetota bacterium]|nr:DsbA family protein [Planctomycetota bacterium]